MIWIGWTGKEKRDLPEDTRAVACDNIFREGETGGGREIRSKERRGWRNGARMGQGNKGRLREVEAYGSRE